LKQCVQFLRFHRDPAWEEQSRPSVRFRPQQPFPADEAQEQLGDPRLLDKTPPSIPT
jgi:hypothetical protein